MSLVVRTEVWNTRQGEVAKAVVRTDKGVFVGATNQTAPVALTIVGAK
jgi:hypothetical protein